MIKAGVLAGRFLLGMQKAWKTAVFGAALTTVFAGSAHAVLSIHIKHFAYKTYQSPLNFPEYDIARDAMKDVYKNTQYEKGTDWEVKPFIDIVQFDLNGDKTPEIIAGASESEIETERVCFFDSTCPHFILQLREGQKKPYVLGYIETQSIDRGDEIKNGYWTLKAILEKRDEKLRPYYDTYVYDKKLDKYVREEGPSKILDSVPPNAKPEPAPHEH